MELFISDLDGTLLNGNAEVTEFTRDTLNRLMAKGLNFTAATARTLASAGKILSEDFWRYTLPVLAASLVWGIAYVLYSVIMGHMGSDAVAANSITSIAKSLLSCLIRGVSGGAGSDRKPARCR